MSDNGVEVYVNDDTMFLVRNNITGTYTSYAGTSEVPTLEKAEIFFVDANNDNTAEYVYVKDGADPSLEGYHLVYVKDGQYKTDNYTKTWKMTDVLLDGVDGTVSGERESYAKTLAAGEGKLFLVHFDEEGIIDGEPALVTSAGTTNSTPLTAPQGCTAIYLGDDVAVNGNNLTSEYDKDQYHMDADTVALGKNVALTTEDLDGYGVWVVYSGTTYQTVAQVYVGEALGENADFTLTALPKDSVVGQDSNYDATVTLPAGATSPTVTITPEDPNATIWWDADNDGNYGAYTGPESIVAGRTYGLKVVSECGYEGGTNGTYTWEIDVEVSSETVKVETVDAEWAYTVNGVKFTAPNCYTTVGTGTAADALAAALADPAYLSLKQYAPQASGLTYEFIVNTAMSNANYGVYADVEDVPSTMNASSGWTGVEFETTLEVGNVIVICDGSTPEDVATYYEVIIVTE